MKTAALVHGAWLVVAIAAFAIGSKRNSEAAGAGDTPTGSGGSAGSKSIRASNGVPDGGGAGSVRGRAGRSGDENLSELGELVLSDGEIRALGREFREASTPIERRLAFSDLLRGLTPENAQLMREQVAHLNHDSAEFREFHYAWGAVGGIDAVFNGADTPKQDMAAGLAGWAATNPRAALAWYEGVDLAGGAKFGPITKGDEKRIAAVRSTLMVGLVYGLSDDDPYSAADYVVRNGSEMGGKTDWMMGMITDKILKADGASTASVRAAGLPEGKQRAGALTKVASTYAREDPEGAAAWLQSMPATDDKSQSPLKRNAQRPADTSVRRRSEESARQRGSVHSRYP